LRAGGNQLLVEAIRRPKLLKVSESGGFKR